MVYEKLLEEQKYLPWASTGVFDPDGTWFLYNWAAVFCIWRN